jgi:hypothetical protein
MSAATSAVAALLQRVRDVESREKSLLSRCDEALAAAAAAQRGAAAHEARASGAVQAARAAQEGFEAELAAKNEELNALHGAVRDLREWHGMFFAAVARDISAMQQQQCSGGTGGVSRMASPSRQGTLHGLV